APAHCAHFVNASFAVKEGYGCKVKGCDFTSALHASFDHLGFRLSCAERLGGAIKLGLFAVGAIQGGKDAFVLHRSQDEVGGLTQKAHFAITEGGLVRTVDDKNGSQLGSFKNGYN